tara:strand:+ start:7343 stop:7501 length:159 start_codon:yes stop_codon:yes gene_type:complete
MCNYFWHCWPFYKKKHENDLDVTPKLEKYQTIYKEGKYYVFLSDDSCDFIEF